MRALRAQGVHLAVDDFGTGYSSLAYLKRSPSRSQDRPIVHRRPWRARRAASAIVAAIVGVADALGLRVIAEGVETAEQAEEVSRLGVLLGQGYFWSWPLPAEDMEAWLRGLTSRS